MFISLILSQHFHFSCFLSDFLVKDWWSWFEVGLKEVPWSIQTFYNKEKLNHRQKNCVQKAKTKTAEKTNENHKHFEHVLTEKNNRVELKSFHKQFSLSRVFLYISWVRHGFFQAKASQSLSPQTVNQFCLLNDLKFLWVRPPKNWYFSFGASMSCH